jgi:hypothetical protein
MWKWIAALAGALILGFIFGVTISHLCQRHHRHHHGFMGQYNMPGMMGPQNMMGCRCGPMNGPMMGQPNDMRGPNQGNMPGRCGCSRGPDMPKDNNNMPGCKCGGQNRHENNDGKSGCKCGQKNRPEDDDDDKSGCGCGGNK